MTVVQHLSEQGMDLIEISGGTYEAPAMTGKSSVLKDSTKKREAYFMDYCEEVRKVVKTPIMLTGGFRTGDGMNEALATGSCDMIGLARSIAVHPEFPNDLLAGKNVKSSVKQLTTGLKFVDNIIPLEVVWYTEQLKMMGRGEDPQPNMSTWKATWNTVSGIGLKGFKKNRAKQK